MKIPADAIKNFTEETAVNIISNNTFENCEHQHLQEANANSYSDCTINPPETMMQILEKIMAIEVERTEMLMELISRMGK